MAARQYTSDRFAVLFGMVVFGAPFKIGLRTHIFSKFQYSFADGVAAIEPNSTSGALHIIRSGLWAGGVVHRENPDFVEKTLLRPGPILPQSPLSQEANVAAVGQDEIQT